MFKTLPKIFLTENQKLNLSSFKTEEEVYEKHILDSLEGLKAFPEIFANTKNLIDVGTGGGFPGLPILIENPNTEVHFLDSTKKKLDAIERMILELKLSQDHKWKMIWGRAEELGNSYLYLSKYDLVIARAVAILPKLLSWCSPFVKKGGHLILWKQSETLDEEIKLAKDELKKFEIIKTHKYCLPNFPGERSLVLLKKV